MHHGTRLTGLIQERLAEKAQRDHTALHIHCMHPRRDVHTWALTFSPQALTSVCSELLRWGIFASEAWVAFKETHTHTHIVLHFDGSAPTLIEWPNIIIELVKSQRVLRSQRARAVFTPAAANLAPRARSPTLVSTPRPPRADLQTHAA